MGGIGLGVFGLAAAYHFQDEQVKMGLARSAKFWSEAMPIYTHYRFVEWQVKNKTAEEQLAAYNRLHDKYTGNLEALTWDLRGFYLKFAQIGATRDEMLPDQFREWAKATQDNVPPELNEEEVKAAVVKSLGKPLEEVFATFDPLPLAAASIGQVHRATLLDGKEVVVKVQYPNIEAKFRADIVTALQFCQLAQPAQLPFMREVEKQFLTEFDYRGEAANMLEIRSNLMASWHKQIEIPRPILKYCTKEVLVMEYLPGVSLISGIRRQLKAMADEQGKTAQQIEDEYREEMRRPGHKHKDLEWSKRELRWYNRYLGVKDAILNAIRTSYNWSLGWAIGDRRNWQYSTRPINLAQVLDTVLKVHAHQMFIDGVFNGDPHPGNIMLLDDGRLGLIDFGQVKHWTDDVRYRYSLLIRALAHDNKEEVVHIANSVIGFHTKNDDPDCVYKLMAFFQDRDTPDIIGDYPNLQLFMEGMEARDPITVQQDDYVMAGRVSILLRGMGNAFDLNLRTATEWLSFAERAIHEYEVKHPTKVYRPLYANKSTTSRIPPHKLV
eukprot:CFRG5648T1